MLESMQQFGATGKTAMLRHKLALSLIVTLGLTITLQSCSNRALYTAIQQNHLQRCAEIPIPQQQACFAQYQTPYEDYRREREALSQEKESLDKKIGE